MIVVGVAQLVERLTVAQAVVGSIPIAHPIKIQNPRRYCRGFFVSVLYKRYNNDNYLHLA